jgi:hypothetical protein
MFTLMQMWLAYFPPPKTWCIFQFHRNLERREQKIIGLLLTAVQGGRLFGAHAGILRLVQGYL